MPGWAGITLLFFLVAFQTRSEEHLIAVSSNFSIPAGELCEQFHAETGKIVVPVLGSTGKHYAQIRRGAPFEAFLAADRERPERLEREGAGIQGTRFTYAIGQIALWSAADGEELSLQTLAEGRFRRLAIANPKLAPYGEAARQALVSLGVWERVKDRLVFGENIAQTFHFVSNRSADLGMVAYSQLVSDRGGNNPRFWLIPGDRYDPIEQQAVLLRESPVARDFLRFLQGESARRTIAGYGYLVP